MFWAIVRWWQDKQRDSNTKGYWIVLRLISFIYLLANRFHRGMGHYFCKKAPLLVISLGSPIAGGSGKTPLARSLIAWLDCYCKSAIISRGYGSKINRNHRVDASHDASIVGDEPWMLSGFHLDQPQHEIIVGTDRYESCKLAVESGCHIALLDDGMQHYRLFRDLDLAVITPSDLDQYLLPYGKLREPITSLERCNWILVKQSHPLRDCEKNRLLKFQKPLCFFNIESPYLQLAPRGEIQEWHVWHQRVVFAFAGIAHPSDFYELLIEKGLKICHFEPLADHQPISISQLMHWMKQAKSLGAEAVICTEKDWARVSHWASLESYPLPILWPQWQVQWQEGSKIFFEFLAHWIHMNVNHNND
jgi:tetraacyldisaccharide 4'-kinase